MIPQIICKLALMYLQVHARHYACFGSTLTCNCAVAVREGNDILGIQACDRTIPPSAIPYLRDPNTPAGTAVIKTLSSNSYKVGACLSKITILLISFCLLTGLLIIGYDLARSACLPNGLSVLHALISFLFLMIPWRPIISGSTVPNFIKFSPHHMLDIWS